MKWKIWPRQYGKSHALLDWWAEDPGHRVILCENEELARIRRRDYESRYNQCGCPCGHPGGSWCDVCRWVHARWHNLLARKRIVSYRTWINSFGGWGSADDQIAIDGLDNMLDELFRTAGRGHVAVVAALGRNDEPNPEIKVQVEAFQAKHAHMFPPGYDQGLG